MARKSKSKPLKNKIKIFCNSLETEVNYFKSFKLEIEKAKISDIAIEVVPTQNKGGKDPISAVRFAIKNREDATSVWVVFDKDEYSINEAIKEAEANDIEVAWSNECFELWFILHFNNVVTSMDRKQCLTKIKTLFREKLKKEYEKNGLNYYECLKDKIKMAITFAKRQHQILQSERRNPDNSNPCTTVYKLVEYLLERS